METEITSVNVEKRRSGKVPDWKMEDKLQSQDLVEFFNRFFCFTFAQTLPPKPLHIPFPSI